MITTSAKWSITWHTRWHQQAPSGV
jgi:hypothetical protein